MPTEQIRRQILSQGHLAGQSPSRQWQGFKLRWSWQVLVLDRGSVPSPRAYILKYLPLHMNTRKDVHQSHIIQRCSIGRNKAAYSDVCTRVRKFGARDSKGYWSLCPLSNSSMGLFIWITCVNYQRKTCWVIWVEGTVVVGNSDAQWHWPGLFNESGQWDFQDVKVCPNFSPISQGRWYR